MKNRVVIFPNFRSYESFDWAGLGRGITNLLGNLGGLLGNVSDVKNGTEEAQRTEQMRIQQQMEAQKQQTWIWLGVLAVVAVVVVAIFKK